MTRPQPPRRLTRRQAGFLGLLAAHGSVWLAVMIFRPSLHAGLICLSSYLAVLAALALLLSVHGAARTTAVAVQPECGRCGVTELTFAHAAGAGWKRVQGLLSCRHCASRFPAWMHQPF